MDPRDASASKNINDSLTDNLKSRDASASKNSIYLDRVSSNF